MSGPVPTTPSPTAHCNAGMAVFNARAFARPARALRMKPGAESQLLSRTTTRSGCIPRSDTSPPPTSCKAWNRSSSRNAIASGKRLGSDGNSPANRQDRTPRLPDDTLLVPIWFDLGGGYGSAEMHPERRSKDQHRSPSRLLTAQLPRLRDWHQRVKPSRHDAATSRQDVAPYISSTSPQRYSISR